MSKEDQEVCQECKGTNRDEGFESINHSKWNRPCKACNAVPCLICDGDKGRGFCSEEHRKQWFK